MNISNISKYEDQNSCDSMSKITLPVEEIIICLVLVILFYNTGSFLYYRCRLCRWNSKNRLQIMFDSLEHSSLSMMCCSSTLPYFVPDGYEHFGTVTLLIFTCTSNLTDIFLYLHLWSRLLIMYKNKKMISYFGKFSTFASSYIYLPYSVAIFLRTGGFVELVIREGPFNIMCNFNVADKMRLLTTLKFGFFASLVFELGLLALMLYPLFKRYNFAVLQYNESQVKLQNLVVRLCLCTAFKLACATIRVISFSLFTNDLSILFWMNMFALTYVFSTISVKCSYEDRRDRLLPDFLCCCQKKSRIVQITNPPT